MIQDIAPKIYKNEYQPQLPGPGDHLLFYEGRKILVKKDGPYIKLPVYEEGCAEEPRYLFAIDEKKFFLGGGQDIDPFLKQGYQYEDIRILRTGESKHLRFAGVTGWQLFQWYESRRFCGRCGASMVHDDKERMMRCPECGLMEFPKICPAVIIAVTDGDRILMSKYAGREYTSYALLAGFAEVGESIEETVKREVMEEVGLKVRNLTYYKSQPWSFSDTLLFGFFCQLDGSDQIRLDRQELSLAEWVTREDIKEQPDDLSLTNEMMQVFKRGEEPCHRN